MNNTSNTGFNLYNLLKSFKNNNKENSNSNIYSNLETAKKEWEEAKNIFENVTNPDLVDYAIYNVDAAEKRYTYLLKQIKNSNTN